MPMQNHDPFARLPSQPFQPSAEIEFLGCKQLVIESAHAPKSCRIAENERARQPFESAAYAIPKCQEAAAEWIMSIKHHGATAGQTAPGLNLLRHFTEQSDAWVRIGVNEHQPLATGRCGPGIARPRDLIDWLSYHGRSRPAGNLGRPVGGIIIANNQFRLPSALPELRAGGLDAAKGFANEPLFIEGRNNDGDFQRINL